MIQVTLHVTVTEWGSISAFSFIFLLSFVSGPLKCHRVELDPCTLVIGLCLVRLIARSAYRTKL